MARYRWSSAIVAIVAATASVPARAGPYSDDLGRCLVSKASETDRATLMRWMFSAIAASPVAAGLATISPEQHRAFNRQTADLFGRLAFVDCRPQTVAAIRYEGMLAIQGGFEILGQAAARGLMGDPLVARELAGVAAFMDADKVKALGKEAGLPDTQAAPPPGK